jgi:hypothetical protein
MPNVQLLSRVLSNPTAIASDVATAASEVAVSVAALGAPGTDSMALAQRIWENNMKLLDQIAELNGIEMPKLEFPYRRS